MRYVIGVDEAGRGALAGPVCVGAVLYPENHDWREAFELVTRRGAPKLRDSKKLSAQARDTLYGYIAAHGALKHCFALVDAETIDRIGIVNAANEAAAQAIQGLGLSAGRAKILLDAGLRAPAHWEQESFVRGDENIPAIAFASIVAKVSRDRFMQELPSTYNEYGFAEHKGYGTLAHRQSIIRSGLTELHRTTFCGNLRVKAKTA